MSNGNKSVIEELLQKNKQEDRAKFVAYLESIRTINDLISEDVVEELLSKGLPEESVRRNIRVSVLREDVVKELINEGLKEEALLRSARVHAESLIGNRYGRNELAILLINGMSIEGLSEKSRLELGTLIHLLSSPDTYFYNEGVVHISGADDGYKAVVKVGCKLKQDDSVGGLL